MCALAALGLATAAAQGAPPAPEEFAGHWEGELNLPAVKLPIIVDLKLEDGRWSGTMDVPMQGTKGMALSSIWVESPVVHFAIPNVAGDPVFEGTLTDGKISGMLRQGGNEVSFYLSREKVAGPRRPQEPKPPYPYRSEEVAYKNGETTLAATLTIPEGEGPFPAVLLATGSGAQNRDEEIFGHKPFWILADDLTRAGIAVLRADDRGVGGSSGKLSESNTADFAEDALAGIRFLRERKEIDKKRVGIVGHSEGALVGVIAAARSKDVRFLVLLAGTGVPGSEVVKLQTARMDRARGLPEAALQAEQKLLDVAFQSVAAGADSASLREAIGSHGVGLRDAAPDSLKGAIQLVQAAVVQMSRAMRSPWFRYFLDFDPRPDLRRLKIPVLALNGELDMQVSADQNLPEIERALSEAKNENVTIRRLPGLNHLFQPATTGLPEEYMQIDTTFDPAALESIRSWIVERYVKD
jgi:pimeloyl-ACP methyl ester carboxylesterase